MTREEANDKVYDLTYQRETTETEIYELLDRIYNDFESMTCENCKYWTMNFHIGAGTCEKGIKQKETIDTWYDTYIDFGCNKFSCKEEKV